MTMVATAIATATVSVGTAAAGGGGIDSPDPPKVSDVFCVETCGGLRKATAGSRIALTGSNLGAVQQVSFPTEAGGRDRVAARNVTARRVDAIVPETAVTGRERVIDSVGNTDRAPVDLRIVSAAEVSDGPTFALRRAEAKPRKAFFDARRKAGVSYTFGGDGPTDVRVDVISRDTGGVVASFRQQDREPYTRNRARWDGRRDGGGPAPDGRYKFRVGPVNGAGAETTEDSRFSLYGHKFPVRARHSYGDGFGAGRGHQGQDVFARCGSRLVAARGGRVKFRDWHSAAGNYVVIDGRRTRLDYMYAHLNGRARVREGERVRTGQVLGEVGDTGNASGCHLHFEVWRGDWQQGGEPLRKVTRLLKRWDGWS